MGDLAEFDAQNGRWIKPSQLAGRQEGVIDRQQLHGLEMSDKQIARGEATGVLHPLYANVWSVGHTKVSPVGRLIGALLSCGARPCFLSHRTAAALHGLRTVNVRAIDITVVHGNVPKRKGLRVHRTRQEPAAGEVRTRDLLRFSSVPRLLIELAPNETDRELDRLITEAARRRLIDPEAIEQALTRHARRPGVARLRTALTAYRPQPDRASELERAFDRWLQGHPAIPEPQRNVKIDGWEVDCFWPDQQVALELDGRPYHVAARDMEKDRLKDVRLQLKGIRVMRVTDFSFSHDPSGMETDLTALLELG